MSKKIKALLTTLLIIFLIFISSFVYATISEYSAAQTQAEIKSSAVISEVNSVLTALGETNLVSTTAKSKINLNAKTDIMRDINYYTVSTQDYQINVDSTTNKVVNIYNLTSNLSSVPATTKDVAREYITKTYSDLNLPSDYDLVYLEPIAEKFWEADFQKNYGGTYNMYEAVKIIFSPANEEIIALTVFDESYSEVATLSAECNAEECISTLSIDEDYIEDISVSFIKPSTLVNTGSTDSSIHKAKVIKQVIPQEEDVNLVTLTYIDFYTGEYLGGDTLQ